MPYPVIQEASGQGFGFPYSIVKVLLNLPASLLNKMCFRSLKE
jgi:hypothetical protein